MHLLPANGSPLSLPMTGNSHFRCAMDLIEKCTEFYEEIRFCMESILIAEQFLASWCS